MSLIIYVLITLISIPLCVGLMLADSQGEFNQKRIYYRKDLGGSIVAGTVFGVIPVVGVLVVLCMTGFAQHGFYFKYRAPK